MNLKIVPTPTTPDDLVTDRIDVNAIKKMVQEKLGLSDAMMAAYTEWIKKQPIDFTLRTEAPTEYEP